MLFSADPSVKSSCFTVGRPNIKAEFKKQKHAETLSGRLEKLTFESDIIKDDGSSSIENDLRRLSKHLAERLSRNRERRC